MMSTLSRYVLQQVGRPMLATLLVAMLVLLAERMLRVVDLVIGWRGSLLVIFEMLGYLVPHYMGLALPAAFFIGILMVVARLSREGELDAMMAAGSGLPQLVRPLLAAAVVLVVINVILVGFLQPYSRFAYRAAAQAVTNASFLTLLREGVFTSLGRTTAMVTRISDDKDSFAGIFIFTSAENGDEVAITAAAGSVASTGATAPIAISLSRGVQQAVPARLDERGAPPDSVTLRFGAFTTSVSDRRQGRLAPRGESERELTLTELFAARNAPPPHIDPWEIEAELGGRLVRSLSIPLLPLLAVPLAVGRRRTHRSYGLAIGLAVLIAYNQVLAAGERLVDNNEIAVALGLWLPFALFAALCLWLYLRNAHRVPRHAGESRLDAALDRLGVVMRRIATRA
jgi:lipopolysaccharide export system permease protein